MYFYIICEKTFFERFGEQIDFELNLYDSDNINNLLSFMNNKLNINITKRMLYYAIKNNMLIHNKYAIYKIKK